MEQRKELQGFLQEISLTLCFGLRCKNCPLCNEIYPCELQKIIDKIKDKLKEKEVCKECGRELE